MPMIEELLKRHKSKAEFCRAVGIKNQQWLVQIEKDPMKIPYTLALTINRIYKTPLYEIRPDIYPPDIFKSKNNND